MQFSFTPPTSIQGRLKRLIIINDLNFEQKKIIELTKFIRTHTLIFMYKTHVSTHIN